MSNRTKRHVRAIRESTVRNGQHAPPPPPLRLDLGCGTNCREGFEGVDVLPFGGKVKHVVDLRQPWPWADGSVAEAHCSHFIEHLDRLERVHFYNELYRVLIPGGKCTLIAPDWSSQRAYGDPTHKWPPMCAFSLLYLWREWRLGNPAKPCPAGCNKGSTPQNQPCPQCGGHGTIVIPANAPHDDASNVPGMFNCDFDSQWGWSLHGELLTRNQDYQQDAVKWHKEACQDLVATLTKR